MQNRLREYFEYLGNGLLLAFHTYSLYLVWKHSNVYDFYTTARPADERTHPDKHQERIEFEANSPCESTVSNESASGISCP